jgi:predicted acetyltransferase
MQEAFFDTPDLIEFLEQNKMMAEFERVINNDGPLEFTEENILGDYFTDKRNIRYFMIWKKKKIIFTTRIFLPFGKGTTGIITMVHTDKEYRRKGICSSSFKKIFQEYPVKKWYLELYKDNISAFLAYMKIGFIPTTKQHNPDIICMSYS